MATNRSFTQQDMALNFREKRLANLTNKVYYDSIKGYMGISNQHSAGTLMTSVPSISIGSEVKQKFKPYEGIDSFEYQPETSFIGHNDYLRKMGRHGQTMSGTSLGKGMKSDFTKEGRLIPGANVYQDPKVLKTDFKSPEIIKREMGIKNNLVKGATLGFSDKYDFTKEGRKIPGANAYSVDNHYNYEQSKIVRANIGYGDKSDFTKEGRHIPGPNQYESKSQFLSPHDINKIRYKGGEGQIPGQSIMHGPRSDFTKESRKIPAPNQYKSYKSDFAPLEDVNSAIIKKGIGAVPGTGIGKGDKSDFTRAQRNLPGPSDYQDKTQMSQFQDKRTQELWSHNHGGKGMISGFGFGKGPRSDFTKEGRKIPGPGAYTRPILNDYSNKGRRSTDSLVRTFQNNYESVTNRKFLR